MSDPYPPPYGSGETPDPGQQQPGGTPPYGQGASSPYGGPPQQPYGGQPPYQGYGYGAPGGTPENHSGAVTALVLGILSLVCCGLFTGIPAMIVGRRAMREIDASQGRYGGRGNAQAGFICGLIGTILSVLGILFYAVMILFAFSMDSGQSPDGVFDSSYESSVVG